MRFKYSNVVLGAAAVLCLAAPVRAEEEAPKKLLDQIPGTFSGSFTLISDYSFRGISQNKTNLALQGGLTWKHDVGFYVGTWGSSIDFGGDTYLEQDFFTGFSRSIDDFTYDFSATFLLYPSETTFNYWEFAAKGSYNFGVALAKAGVVYSPDYFGTLDNGVYVSTGVTVPIPGIDIVGLSLDGNVGYTLADTAFLASDDDYVDWNVGLIVALSDHLSADLRYVDTDDNSQGDLSDARFVGGATFAF